MVKKIKNTPFWNVLRRGSAATLALIVVAMSCFVPISAADEPTEPTEPVYSEGLDYTFSGSTATVTGPGTWTGGELRIPPQVTVDGVTYSVTAIGASAFEGDTTVTKLIMPNSVTSIGNYAFQNCTLLISVEGGSDLAPVNSVFAFCTSLVSVDFSTWKEIKSYCFDRSGLTTVVIPSNVTSFELSAFCSSKIYDCALKQIFYSAPTIISEISNGFWSSFESLYYDGSLLDYISSVPPGYSNTLFNSGDLLYVSGKKIEGHLSVPENASLAYAFSGLDSITSLYVPGSVSFRRVSSSYYDYRRYFMNCTSLKNVVFSSSDQYAFSTKSGDSDRAIFYGCTSLEVFYYNGSLTTLSYVTCFYNTNTTFTLYLPGTSDQYTLTGFSNPVVYGSVACAPDFVDLYTDSPLVVEKGAQLSATVKPLKNYGLPTSVDVCDVSGNSLGWTNGVEYTYNSTTGAFTVAELNQNIRLVAVGVSLVPQYYFFNETPQFIYFVGDFFTFEATDFNGVAVTGAFVRLEDERLCFYLRDTDSDNLVWTDDTGWSSPLYRYLDFGSFDIGEDLSYFLRTTASVPSIGSMLSQIYNASGGGSSGGSYDTGYSDGYDVGFEDGRDVGYGEGYDVGFEDGSAGGSGGDSDVADSILALASYRLDFERDGQYVHSMTITPKYSLGSVYFGTLEIINAISDYEETYGDIDRVRIAIIWNDSDTFDYSLYPLFVTGTSLVETASLVTTDGVSLPLIASWGDGFNGQTPRLLNITAGEIPNVVLVKTVYVDVGRPQDLLQEFTLGTNTYFYTQGYNDGYNVGYGIASSEVGSERFNAGYREGVIVGKSEGIAIAEKGNFYNLFFSVSDAVYSNLLNLLNFEILGVNMRVVFGSFLTVCLVLIVVFKFTGKN